MLVYWHKKNCYTHLMEHAGIVILCINMSAVSRIIKPFRCRLHVAHCFFRVIHHCKIVRCMSLHTLGYKDMTYITSSYLFFFTTTFCCLQVVIFCFVELFCLLIVIAYMISLETVLEERTKCNQTSRVTSISASQ